VPSSKGVSAGPMMTAFLHFVSHMYRDSTSRCLCSKSRRFGAGQGGRQCRVRGDKGESYQVMTLSAMGEAETPAGGSVCMRCVSPISTVLCNAPVVLHVA
jgi:hypothetical protein